MPSKRTIEGKKKANNAVFFLTKSVNVERKWTIHAWKKKKCNIYVNTFLSLLLMYACIWFFFIFAYFNIFYLNFMEKKVGIYIYNRNPFTFCRALFRTCIRIFFFLSFKKCSLLVCVLHLPVATNNNPGSFKEIGYGLLRHAVLNDLFWNCV